MNGEIMNQDVSKEYEGKLALLVDDDEDFLAQMKVQIESLGFKTATADSQGAAEALLRDISPDLAIIDLMMENLDAGFVLSYEIKAKCPKTPVIMVTGVVAETGMEFDANTRQERTWIKADVILSKPVRLEQLKREIGRLLK